MMAWPYRAFVKALEPRRWSVAAAVAFVLMMALPALAESQSPSFTLDLAAPAVQELALTVQAPAVVPIKIIRGGGAGAVTLDVSTFVNEQGVSVPVPVSFSVDGAGGAGVSHLDGVSFDKPLLALDLHVPALPSGGKYTGRLILSTPGQTQGRRFGVLSSPPPTMSGRRPW